MLQSKTKKLQPSKPKVLILILIFWIVQKFYIFFYLFLYQSQNKHIIKKKKPSIQIFKS